MILVVFQYLLRFFPISIVLVRELVGLGPKQSKIVDDRAKQHLKYHHMLKVYDSTILK